MEGASKTPSADSKQTAPGRRGDACLERRQVFNGACSGKEIRLYFLWGRLILYSHMARVDLIMFVKNDKCFVLQILFVAE